MCLDLFFLLLIISGLWENENTRGMVCSDEVWGYCSFVVRKVRESIHLKKTRNYGII